MATWTTAQLQALHDAYATGARDVTDADGNRITFRSLAEMDQVIGRLERDATTPQRPTSHLGKFSRGYR
jgi:hypothetical protein